MEGDGNEGLSERKEGEEGIVERPEIDRGVLGEILLGGLDEDGDWGAVRWGRKVKEAVPDKGGEGKWKLRFHEGGLEVEEGGFDLVVGADGGWSTVRNVLTAEQPRFAGVVGLEVWAMDVLHGRQAWMAGLVGKGTCVSCGDGKAVQMQRVRGGGLRAYAWLRTEREGFLEECGIDWSKGVEARGEFVKRYFGDLRGELKRVLLESGDGMVLRKLYQLPGGFRWVGREGVTLVGDAAHLMMPFGGIGVDTAMVDAMELGRGIVRLVKEGHESGKSLADVVREYEEGLFFRGEACARKTVEKMEELFSAMGSEELTARLRKGDTSAK